MTDRNHLTVHLYHCNKHITITMTGLYANLVTCDRLHALTLIAYLQLCHLSATCIHVVIMFITVLLFICYLVFLPAVISYYYICTWFLLHELFPLYTHSLWSRSDDPGFARPDIGRLFLMCRCSTRLFVLRGTGRSFFYFWYFTSLYSVIS